MKKIDKNHYLWIEKYRPQTIEDVILPESTLNKFKEDIKSGQIQNYIFSSTTPGEGKTATAKSLIKDLGSDFLFINASKDSGIDTLRNTIYGFATSASLNDSVKVVIMDEIDGSSNTSIQGALRGVIEEVSKNCRFIFTCNYVNKIMEPIRNRCTHIDFDELFSKNKAELGKKMLDRLEFILENENIKNYEKDSLKLVIQQYYPSMREMINTLQTHSSDGTLHIDQNLQEFNHSFETVINTIKAKDFNKMRSSIEELSDPSAFYSFVWKNMSKYFTNESLIPLTIGLHQYMNSDVSARDKSIPLAAFGASVMSSDKIKFK